MLVQSAPALALAEGLVADMDLVDCPPQAAKSLALLPDWDWSLGAVAPALGPSRASLLLLVLPLGLVAALSAVEVEVQANPPPPQEVTGLLESGSLPAPWRPLRWRLC